MTANLRVLDALIDRDSDKAVPQWTLGDRLGKALAHSGLTAADMAEALDVTPTTISRWINDKSPVRRSTLLIWAVATGVDHQWLETGVAGPENRTGQKYAIRDSNPEPADSESRPVLRLVTGVNRGLTVDRVPAGHRAGCPAGERFGAVCGCQRARHLVAVGE